MGKSIDMAKIVVDVRESGLLDALKAHISHMSSEPSQSVTVESAALPIGDILLSATTQAAHAERRLLIERKSLADLAASIKDGRYREQKARMLATHIKDDVMYIIEVPSSFRFTRSTNKVNGMPLSSLQSAIASLLVKSGVRTMLTRDVADTAGLVLKLLRYLSEAPTSASKHEELHEQAMCIASTVNVKRIANLDSAQCLIQQLAQIPGISFKLASTIVESFKVRSMAGMISTMVPLSSAERLKRLRIIPGIGLQKARVILNYLFAESAHSENQTHQTHSENHSESSISVIDSVVDDQEEEEVLST